MPKSLRVGKIQIYMVMKKIIYFSIIAVLSAFTFTSCEQDVVTSPVTVDLLPKANISGNVTAELNLQSYGKELAPSGTQLLVEINYSDLNSTLSASAGKWKDTVTVDENGKYNLSVPAGVTTTTVTITPLPFEYNQVQSYGALYPTIKMAYTYAVKTIVSINAGQSIIQNIDYPVVSTSVANFVDKVRIAGKVTANTDVSVVGNEKVPDNTVIYFYNSSSIYNSTWKDSVKVINGAYSIVVPKNITIYWSSKFSFNKNTWNSVNSTYVATVSYIYSVSSSGMFNSNSTDANPNNIDFGEGSVDVTLYPIYVVLSGSALADYNQLAASPGSENFPSGTKIYFNTAAGDWVGVATVDATGRYTINVPQNKTIYYTTSFLITKTLSNGTTVPNTTFTASGNTSVGYSYNTPTVSLNITAY